MGGRLLEPAEKEKLLPGAYRPLEQASSEATKRLDGDAVVSNFCSALFKTYPGEFDDAAPWILERSAYANLMRDNIIKRTSPTVDDAYALMPSSPDDTGVGEPVPSLSLPKTGKVSDVPPASFEESLQTESFPMIRDHPQTTTGAYYSDSGLSNAHELQAASSQGHDTKNHRDCPFCGTVFGASQGPM